MRRWIIVSLLLLGALGVAAGQSRKPSARPFDRWEIFAGYTFSRDTGDPNVFSSTSSQDKFYSAFVLNGGEVAVSYYPSAHIGLTVDYDRTVKSGNSPDGTYWGSNSMQRILAGPSFRYALAGPKLSNVTLNGHLLVGTARVGFLMSVPPQSASCGMDGTTCVAYGTTFVPGGGVDVKLTRHLSVRPVQLDYWMHNWKFNDFVATSETSSEKSAGSGLRYSAGVVLHF